ncbi:MAG: GAF domain-containing protein, partial [Cyanobacteria bacterium]|nr:GAF domain-containing protein [Cyanobacteriota bacterium]MDW8203274.1 adenylate/guanylate cyclase domain-containing protein [Cyanobacteriota bacterium SKYGB_h_bin112]
GTLSDISDRKQYEAAAHLLQTLIQAITEAPDFNTALQVTLYQVCEVTGWDYGEVWVRAGDRESLQLSPIWYGKTSELSIFRQLSQAYVLPINNSLHGRVWLAQQAVWIPDVSQLSIQEFSRAAIAQEAGLRANFGVPIVANGETLAVLSFFMLSAHPENQHQIELVTAVAQQLGSVIQIKRTEDALHEQQRQSERLLLNILPAPIAERLKRNNHRCIADSFSEVTVMFADLVNFSAIADHTPPQALVELLNHIFSTFDRLAAQHGLEKIKTIGDAYMVVGGLPIPRPDHAEAIADMALSMQQAICTLSQETGEALSLRIGIHTGPVVAGVIGITKFSYDLWGDAVNIASRMESQGLPSQIQVSAAVYDRLCGRYLFQERGAILVKGKGEMTTYLLQGKK